MTNRKDDTPCVSIGVVVFCLAVAGISEGSVATLAVAIALSLVAIAWGL